MHSVPNNYWNCLSEEDHSLTFKNECQSLQQSAHDSLHHSPYQPIHQPAYQPPMQPLQKLPSQQLPRQDLFHYTERFEEKSSILRAVLTHDKKTTLTTNYCINPDNYSPTINASNQIVSRDWETFSSSSSSQISPTVAENQSNVQEVYRQQQNPYEQNYTNHSGGCNPPISMSSRSRMQALHLQNTYLQQESNCNNNNNKQRNRHRDISNRQRFSSHQDSTSFAWVNRTNGK